MNKVFSGIVLALIPLMVLVSWTAEYHRPIETVSPEACVLCNAENYPNLCLLDLQTGAVEELKVYDTGLYSEDLMYYEAREFSREQTMGTLSLIHCAGLEGIRVTGSYPRCELTLPGRPGRIRSGLYCRDCYDLLRTISGEGYVLLDTYDTEHKTAHPLENGTVRCFDISVEDGLLTVTGRMEVIEGGPYGKGLLRALLSDTPRG